MLGNFLSFEESLAITTEWALNYMEGVTKINDLSVISGLTSSFARILQTAQKENILNQSFILPDLATGVLLDKIAESKGIGARFGSLGSSTYIRVVGDIGTTYTAGTHTFTGVSGVVFDVVVSKTIGAKGYTYVPIRSQSVGAQTNVKALDLQRVVPEPSGHQYCINEFRAIGGRDIESDLDFRNRIKQYANFVAKSTIAQIQNIFQKINPNVLRVIFNGYNGLGKLVLGVVTQNGATLLPSEIDNLLEESAEFFSLCEIKPEGAKNIGVLIRNIEFYPIDVSFRCRIMNNANIQNIRQTIQTNFARLYDWRYFKMGSKVEWDDLLEIVKNTEGVEYLFDDTFFPRNDLQIPTNKLPRFRGFLMLDEGGAIITGEFGNELNPNFYPSEPDFSFQNTIL